MATWNMADEDSTHTTSHGDARSGLSVWHDWRQQCYFIRTYVNNIAQRRFNEIKRYRRSFRRRSIGAKCADSYIMAARQYRPWWYNWFQSLLLYFHLQSMLAHWMIKMRQSVFKQHLGGVAWCLSYAENYFEMVADTLLIWMMPDKHFAMWQSTRRKFRRWNA